MTSPSYTETAEFIQFLSKSSGVQLNSREVEQKSVAIRCFYQDIEEQEVLSLSRRCQLEGFAIVSSEFRGFLKRIKEKGVWQSYVALPRLPVFVSFANQQVADKDSPTKFHRVSFGFFAKKTEQESIFSTLTEHRRVTIRNVIRWSQQLMTSMNYLHKNYIVAVPVSLNEVHLQSDWPLVRGIWDITKSKTVSRKANSDPNLEIPRGSAGRQAWLDVTGGELSGKKDLEFNHFYSELKKLDSLGSGSLTLKPTDNAGKRDRIIQLYTEYLSGVQSNLRDIGIIVLQLVARRVFSDKELKYWKQWTLPSDDSQFRRTEHQNDSDSVGSSSKRSEHDRSINTQFMQKQVELRLQDICPDILNYPMEFRSIVSLCFFPVCAPEVLEQEVKRGTVNIIVRSVLLKSIRKVCNMIEETIAAYIEDGKFVKQSEWTEEDEEKRVENQLARSKLLREKARHGVHAAALRIKAGNEQTWWHMQTDEYRAKMKRRKRIQQEAEQKQKVHKQLIVQASFHWWDEDRIKIWLRNAFQKYYSQIVKFHDAVEQMKPKKPEIYIRRVIDEVYSTLDDFYVDKILAKYSFGLEDFYNKLHPIPQSTSKKKDIDDEIPAVPFSLEMLSKQERIDYCAKIIFDQLSSRLSRRSGSLRIAKLFRVAQQEEENEIKKIGEKLLVTSDEQLFYKKLSLRCEHAIQSFSELKDVVKEFHQELQVIDRQKAKRICMVLSAAALAQFELEYDVRSRGENEAALRICAFFHLIHAKIALVPAARVRRAICDSTNVDAVKEIVSIVEQHEELPTPELIIPVSQSAKPAGNVIKVHDVDNSSNKLVWTFTIHGIDKQFRDEWTTLKCSSFKLITPSLDNEPCSILSSPKVAEQRIVVFIKGPTQFYFDEYGKFPDLFQSRPDKYEPRYKSSVESIVGGVNEDTFCCDCEVQIGDLVAGENYQLSLCFDKNLSTSICNSFPQLLSSKLFSPRFEINQWVLKTLSESRELLYLAIKTKSKLKPVVPHPVMGVRGKISYWKDLADISETKGYSCYLNSDSKMTQSFESIIKLDWDQSNCDSPAQTVYELQRRLILINDSNQECLYHLCDWAPLDSNISVSLDDVKSISNCNCFDSFKMSSKEFATYISNTIAPYVATSFTTFISSPDDLVDSNLLLVLEYRIRIRNSQGVGAFSRRSAGLKVNLGSIFLDRNNLIEKGKLHVPRVLNAFILADNSTQQYELPPIQQQDNNSWSKTLQFLQAQSPLLR